MKHLRYTENGRLLYVFVIGSNSSYDNKLIEEEAKIHGDILMYNGPDDYMFVCFIQYFSQKKINMYLISLDISVISFTLVRLFILSFFSLRHKTNLEPISLNVYIRIRKLITNYF